MAEKLHIENLGVRYGEAEVLKSIDLSVEEGELIALLGPSGCGKSTLLKALCGLIECNSGRILVDGDGITALPTHKRRLSIIFQDLRLFPHMNVRENVEFPLKVQKIPSAQRRETALEILASVQLEDLAERRIRELSGGQQQRVALARALVTRPSILLLDEPFSALDENLRQDMRDLLRAIRNEYRVTTIFVTHDQREALEMSDRIAVLHNGSIAQFDTPHAIYERPNCLAVAEYFGAENIIEGTVDAGVFIHGSWQIAVDADDGPSIVVLRPETVSIVPEGSGYTVSKIQYHGSSSVAVLERGTLSIVALAVDENNVHEGDDVGIAIDPTRLLVFPK